MGNYKTLAATAGSLACGLLSAEEKPNIVVILTDDHAFQAISAYEHPISKIAKTPNIDRIAKKGMLFTRAYVENSISAPSRATTLTGMYSHHHEQTRLGWPFINPSRVFFSELLQKAGYKTAVFGKWHLNAQPKGFGYYDLLHDQGEYYNPVMCTPSTNGKFITQPGYATTVITDHSLEWLDTVKTTAPFCVMINHKAPHRNWMPELKYIDLFNDVEFPEPPTLREDLSNRGRHMQEQELSIENHMGYAFDFKVEELKDEPTLQYIKDSWDIAMNPMSVEQRTEWDRKYAAQNREFLANRPTGDDLLRWKYQRYIKDYCRTIRSVDDQVGRVLDYLDKNGLSDNTIIIYTSDQGFLLGEHGLYDKRFMYEESFRTPLLIAFPNRIKANSVCSELVQNIDIAPTLLNIAGVKVPSDMDGTSLAPLFKSGKTFDWRVSLYYQFYDHPAVGNVRKHYGIGTKRYKLIHWLDQGDTNNAPINYWELFDLQKDPCETVNLYGNPKYKAIQSQLHIDLAAMQKKIY